MIRRSLNLRLRYTLRDFRSRALYGAVREHCSGRVLDVGGGDFFATAKAKGARFDRWVTLEVDPGEVPDRDDPRQQIILGDGCRLPCPDARFDTALSIQVLEHVFEPIRMVAEIGRVLKPGGKALFLIPQTSTTHMAPHYYANYSRYWIASAMNRAGLEIVLHRPLGGFWSSIASRLVYFPMMASRVSGMSDPAIRRGALFYVLLPVMVAWAVISVPVCMLLALGDLEEEPNNHLVVARKR